MRDHAVFFTPLRLTTGTFIKVARFRLHDTHVTASQFAHTHETVALRVAFLGFFTAVTAKNIASKSEC
jgi:hypothetical protein